MPFDHVSFSTGTFYLGTKIKEPSTSSSFVFLHFLHNISFGIFRKIKGDNLA